MIPGWYQSPQQARKPDLLSLQMRLFPRRHGVIRNHINGNIAHSVEVCGLRNRR